jgi:hypothetical protein
MAIITMGPWKYRRNKVRVTSPNLVPARASSPADILGAKLAKALECLAGGEGQVVARRHGHIALIDIAPSAAGVSRAQREALIGAVKEVWGKYSFAERCGLGYEVTLDGKPLTWCA